MYSRPEFIALTTPQITDNPGLRGIQHRFRTTSFPTFANRYPNTMISPFTNSFLSPKAVTLGRLVLNLKDPGQAFCPHAPVKFTFNDVDKSPFLNAEVELDEQRETRFTVKLTKLFQSNAEASKSSTISLRTEKITRCKLLNIPEIFKKIRDDKDTRIWLEEHFKTVPIHLAVSLLTIQNACINNTAERTSKIELSGDAPLTEAIAPGSSMAPIPGDQLDVQADFARSNAEKQNAVFLIPGERIIGVQYIRLKFKGFKSSATGGVSLDPGDGRWIKYTGNHIVRGDVEDGLKVTLEGKPSVDDLDEYFGEFEQIDVGNPEGDIIIIVSP